jgi:hypothetical protein
LNWLSYGQREYDATLGRFFAIDRFADKYFDLSPYHYCAGNPVRFIDVNGDSLTITKSEQGGKELLAKQVDDKLKGFYTLSINEKTGLASLNQVKGADVNKMTDSQKGFYENLSSITSLETGNTKIELVVDSKEVGIVNKEKGIIDVGDIDAIGKQNDPFVSGQGVLIHELAEQSMLQNHADSPIPAHKIGINTQNTVDTNGKRLSVPDYSRKYTNGEVNLNSYYVSGSKNNRTGHLVSIYFKGADDKNVSKVTNERLNGTSIKHINTKQIINFNEH